MGKINDILNRKGSKSISVLPGTSVFDALKVMADNNIGSVVVMEDKKFLGIVTERDYSRKVVLKGKNSSDTKVNEIMTSEFPLLKPSDSVEYCMGLLTKNNIRYLPVFEEKNLAGIISISDVVKETIITQQQTIDHLHDYIHS
ncbi:MAG: CBS domain-containing protein [Ginsengibacter sp.]